ncbi:MAG: hypothetical protein HQM13_13625 [SAR324 cluster bacterium]|nr:hypothetical protein [SAR324 cluster bacterium]
MKNEYLSKITREDIQIALKEFLEHGGKIEVLPSPEKEAPRYVGEGKYQIDENIQGFF